MTVFQGKAGLSPMGDVAGLAGNTALNVDGATKAGWIRYHKKKALRKKGEFKSKYVREVLQVAC